jgi:hypothetical protein
MTTQLDTSTSYQKALRVLDMLLSLLHMWDYLVKFNFSVPVSRVALYILGDEPPSEIAARVLELLGLVHRISPSFARKFELVHGWLVLRHVLPTCWDAQVQKAAFDLVVGRADLAMKQQQAEGQEPSYCLSIMPAILASFFVSIERPASGAVAITENSDGKWVLLVATDTTHSP